MTFVSSNISFPLGNYERGWNFGQLISFMYYQVPWCIEEFIIENMSNSRTSYRSAFKNITCTYTWQISYTALQVLTSYTHPVPLWKMRSHLYSPRVQEGEKKDKKWLKPRRNISISIVQWTAKSKLRHDCFKRHLLAETNKLNTDWL